MPKLAGAGFRRSMYDARQALRTLDAQRPDA
jgi:hypothetical protein